MVAGEFVAVLAAELRARLVVLERERRAITRALQALEPRAPRRRVRDLDEAILERLRDSPGSRASLLALELGVDASTATARLQSLEDAGVVTRVGMRWEVV
jgi:DNA-binding transcriptional ArsR family regulator